MTRKKESGEWEAEMASRLRRLRDAAGLSQERLAREIGVSTRAVQGWEYGKRDFSFKTAARLAKALGVDLNTLGGEEDAPRKKGGAK
jgi:transcriptional regulator with XRE-family HTH domain